MKETQREGEKEKGMGREREWVGAIDGEKLLQLQKVKVKGSDAPWERRQGKVGGLRG